MEDGEFGVWRDERDSTHSSLHTEPRRNKKNQEGKEEEAAGILNTV